MVTLVSFLVFIALFIGVGLYSIKFKKRNVNDYYVASKGVSAPLVGLSAIVSLFSGFMFLGLIGAIYKHGLAMAWLMIASTTVHILAYKFYINKFSNICSKKNYSTFVQFLSKHNGTFFYKFSVIASIFVLVFLGAIASAQLAAGAKTIHSFYDIDLNIGAALVVFIVALYCYAGGIRASIWTDAVQSVVMFFAMLTLIIFALNEVGGFSQLFSKLEAIDSKYTNLIVGGSYLKSLNSFIGWLFLSAIFALGMPYIMIRYMTLSEPKQIKKVGIYFNSYLAIFYTSTLIAGLCARVLISPEDLPDTEYAFLILSQRLLPEFLIGIILAGIFSSIISTTDSLILTCSASITKDIFPKLGNKYIYAKLSTIVIAVLIYLIYLSGSKSIFDLVLLGGGALGSAFTPLVILFINKRKTKEITQIIMTITAISTYIYWNKHYNSIIHEAVPAVFSAFFVYWVGEVYYKLKKAKMIKQFAVGE